ncbi:39S ribosomal protein L10, mitochondrial-like isoform X1 [Varroa jacobsoni]|uniref:39S ribosomal protein L10, mitochondrial-like isoform X1 n=1 Tax=Varroa jacobsoni TaxID=62625 RepID=UPI000BF5BFBF|nr:39S ribosomal protein L10, mitochondrial-like isoform X1 [Varroa jacobsoni]
MIEYKHKMSASVGFNSSLNLGRKAIQLRCVQVSQMRFRRIQTRNPPEPHFDRKAMLEVCKPIIPPKEKVCGHLNRVERIYEPHPWNVLKAKRLRANLEEASMILFYHKNSVKREDDFKIHNMLFKKKLYLQTNISNEVTRLAIKDTFLANATPFTFSKNAIIISPHKNITVAIELLKKMPQYILLAGVIDRIFLSRDQLQWLATVPSIGFVQAITAKLLATHSQNLCFNLNRHQLRLSNFLAEHSKTAFTTTASSPTATTGAPPQA